MRKLFSLITAILFVGTMWATPEQLYLNQGANGTDANGITVTGNVNTTSSNGNPGNSLANTSSGNTTFTFEGFSLSSYSNLELQLDAAFKSFPATTNTFPYATVTFYKNDEVVKTDNTTIKWTTKVNTYSTYTISNIPDFDKIVIVGSPAIGKTGKGADATNYSLYMDNITILGEGSSEPSVTVAPNPIAFGDIKQYAEGPLETQYVFKNFTVTGENLTSAITVTAPAGAIFSLWNVATETTIGTSIELEPDGDGAVEKELAIMAATAWSGAQNSSITISGDDLDEDMTVNITMNVTPRYSVDVEVNDDEMGSATINGGSVAYVENESEELTLVATPKPGYEFVNWTYDGTKVLLDAADDEASTTAYAYEEVTITANFQAMSCTGLAAPVYKGYYTTYQTLRLNWEAVENASSYLVNIKQGETPIVEDASITELLYVKAGLTANTEYTITVMAVGDGTTYCAENNPVLEKTYTLPDYPAATLTLSENGETRAWGSELKIASVIALPTAVAAGQEVAGKVLVGYTNEANKTYSHDTDAPATLYAPGANYTIADTEDKLYAVYAIEALGSTTWNEITALPTAGTYAICSDDYFMKASVSSSRFENGSDEPSITDGELDEDPVSACQWEISVYNADTFLIKNGTKYAGAAAKNTGALLTEVTDFAKWKISYSGGFTFKNVGRANSGSNTGNAFLRNNGSNGWAAYAESTGSAPRLFKKVTTVSSYTKYATTGTKAPRATVAPTSVAIEATAVIGGLIDVTYENVNTANVAVALFDDATCKTAFSGEWLNVSLDANKDIEYGAAANASYANARTAYIQLTAPSPADGVDPAVVVIPVTQAKKEAVFASLAELVASDLAEDSATVSFENIAITGFYKTTGVYLNVKGANDKDIEIYRSGSDIPASWVVGGTLSGTVRGKWTYYTDGDVWEIVPKYGWEWTNLTYKAPTATSIDNAEAEAQAVKFIQNGQIFIEKNGVVYNVMGQEVR